MFCCFLKFKLEYDSNKGYKFDELEGICEKALEKAYGNDDFQDYKHGGILHYSENCSGCGSFSKCYYSCTCVDSDDINSNYNIDSWSDCKTMCDYWNYECAIYKSKYGCYCCDDCN